MLPYSQEEILKKCKKNILLLENSLECVMLKNMFCSTMMTSAYSDQQSSKKWLSLLLLSSVFYILCYIEPKKIGMSLKDIKIYLEQRNPSIFLDLLEEKSKEVAEKIKIF